VIEWAERALRSSGAEFHPQILAQAHYLLGAGHMLAGHPLVKVEDHLVQAASLAADNNLPEVSASSQFELGNLLAQRGDLANALKAFERTIALAQAAGARFLEIVGHNNLAYHAHLMGDLTMARQHIQVALSLADMDSIFLPRQYLYSTRGEIALAEGELDEAERWFRRALAEADRHGNRLQAANIRANLGLVARARGDLDEALVELEAARRAAADVTARHLQIQIDLWLAELYLQRGEQTASREALARAEERLAGSERRGLETWAAQVRAALR
jgi:tetratricopeptide (TPR) repeat protein